MCVCIFLFFFPKDGSLCHEIENSKHLLAMVPDKSGIVVFVVGGSVMVNLCPTSVLEAWPLMSAYRSREPFGSFEKSCSWHLDVTPSLAVVRSAFLVCAGFVMDVKNPSNRLYMLRFDHRAA